MSRSFTLCCLLVACSAPPKTTRGFRATASCTFTGSVFGAVPFGGDVVLSLYELDAIQQLRLSDCSEQRRWKVSAGPRALIGLNGGYASASAAALSFAFLDGGSSAVPTTLAPSSVLAADLDGDGIQELIATLGATASEARVSVTRAQTSTQELAVIGASALASADLDGDGDADILVARTTEHRLTVLTNAAGTLTASAELSVCDEPFAVTTVRIGAELPTIVVTCRTGGLELLRPADGGYAHQPLARAGTLYQTVIADFDVDGQLDLASVDPFAHKLVVWWGKAPGAFEAPVEFATGLGPILLRPLDFDTDGRPDLLVLAFQDRSVTVFRSEGTR